MSCPGITVHCPGCSGGQSIAVLGAGAIGLVVAYQAFEWVATRIWWIGGTLAACFVLSVAASTWLAGLTERREAAFAARHGILSRADVILPAPKPKPQVTQGTDPHVIEHHHYVHHLADGRDAVRVIPGKVLP
jgi:hypothetical protein